MGWTFGLGNLVGSFGLKGNLGLGIVWELEGKV